MASDRPQRRLAAILSADAVGYSQLMARDDEGTVRTLQAHRDALAGHVRQYGGRVVDDVGDNLLAEFPSVIDAVGCAVAAQRTLHKRNAELEDDAHMPFRMGVHLGDVVVEDERIYGDGVNIAARLQGLAQSGGVCISATVHEQVRSHFPRCEDLGEQSLKNIEHPVRTYRVRIEKSETGDPATTFTVPGFGGRPAIAVLAFDNLSDDANQEYFADGIAEDLITRLSSVCDLPVISRNSSFVYKGRAVDMKQVSRELGVRYVVEGSVRKAGEQVRVTAQLVDATTGHHVWAERYDRGLNDIFAVQDEITETIAGAVLPAVGRVEIRRAMSKAPESLDAWDCIQRAQWQLQQHGKPGNLEAQALCRRAIALDPQSARAHGLLASIIVISVFQQWVGDPVLATAEALRLAERSVALDREDALARESLGWSLTFSRQSERAVSELEQALALNPSLTRAYWALGTALTFLHRLDEAGAMIEKSIRLSRNDPMMPLSLHGLGMTHFLAGRHEEAADCARRALALQPDLTAGLRLRAASCGHLGRLPEARDALAEMARLDPDFSQEAFRFLNETAADPIFEGWRKAGWEG